jgi:hypothetical protein
LGQIYRQALKRIGDIVLPIDQDWGNWDHQICIAEEAYNLMKLGYRCYLEYEIELPQRGYYRNGKVRHKVIVDLYATKGSEKILVEVGTLAPRRENENRINLLKKLMPRAKIIWVHQWKNYGITDSYMIWHS